MKRSGLFILFYLLGISSGFIGFEFYITFFTISPQVSSALGVSTPHIVGFQPYWLVDKAPGATGSGERLYDRFLTTLTYFDLIVATDGGIIKTQEEGRELEPGWAMLHKPSYIQLLQTANSRQIKKSLLVANMNEDEILQMLTQPEVSGTTLVTSVAPIMRSNGFTDLNLDIESFVESSDATRSAYVSFVRAVKRELDAQQLGTLTVELTPKSPTEMHFIDVPSVAAIADYLVLMAYDYHYSLSPLAGPVAPISGAGSNREYDVTLALTETLKYVPPEKLLLGIPSYGYEWETLSNIPGSPVIPQSWQVVSHRRAEELLSTCTDCVRGIDRTGLEPFIIRPDEGTHFHQYYYEDAVSLQKKIDLAVQYNLAGIAVWAMGYEDASFLEPMGRYKRELKIKN